ncbi:MAG: PBSX family phage terminase large subunit [Oscillospiraceae bacterium]|nr:PBSX family phage terminase large subunit [Oscillospiraceae bacterium]
MMRGSAGSGKSYDTAQFYIIRILSQPGRNLLCVRKTDLTNRVSTYSELTKAINRLGLQAYFKCTVSPLMIRCVNGNMILFGGCKDESQREKLKSITALKGNITDIWCEEATELSQEDYDTLDDRLRGRLPDNLFYQMRFTFNPVSASHWIKGYFFDAINPNVYCHKSTYRDNAFADPGQYARMELMRVRNPERYKIYGMGEWGNIGGLVFNNYEVKDLTGITFDDERYGQDFGFNHASALLDVGIKDGDIYITREIYKYMTTNRGMIRAANEDGKLNKRIPLLCDSAEPDRIQEWYDAGYNAMGVNKQLHEGSSLSYSIEWLQDRKIYISPDCPETLREISTWSWKKDPQGRYTDIPIAYGDDAMAALRYACFDWIPQEEDYYAKRKKHEKKVFAFDDVFEKSKKPGIDKGKTVII